MSINKEAAFYHENFLSIFERVSLTTYSTEPFRDWFPLKGSTYLNLLVKAACLLKYVWPFSGRQH